jgi:hypothetical protein
MVDELSFELVSKVGAKGFVQPEIRISDTNSILYQKLIKSSFQLTPAWRKSSLDIPPKINAPD